MKDILEPPTYGVTHKEKRNELFIAYMESVVPLVTEYRDKKFIENVRSMYVEYIDMLDVDDHGKLV